MLLKRGTGNGERGMGNGERGMGNGKWEMGNGEWLISTYNAKAVIYFYHFSLLFLKKIFLFLISSSWNLL